MIEDNISARLTKLKMKVAQRYNISPEKCHIGFISLESMLENPDDIHQIDGATDASETNKSVSTRSMRLASAMTNAGLQPGDAVLVMGPNHLDIAVPYYSCHFNGYPICTMDPVNTQADIQGILPYVKPKLIFCQTSCVEKIEESLNANKMEVPIVTFDSIENNMETFINKYQGTEVNYRPAEFDSSKIGGWLMLTSGTTGLPKVSVITFDSLYTAAVEWWSPITDKIGITMSMTGLQWLSSLMFYLTTPLKPFTRLQSSVPLSPPLMISMINKYKPNATAWTPYLLAQFVQAAGNLCDLSSLQHILVGGSAMEKHIVDEFRKKCKATLYLVYGMTELCVPIFDYDDDTPFGAAGKKKSEYKYKLVDDEGNEVDNPEAGGELWVKGEVFFKGYLNNPEETKKIITDDGWIKTGDIFRVDANNYYYFVERKKTIIRYLTHWLSPLQLEEVIKQHLGVAEACVVPIPNPQTMELPVGAIKKKDGSNVEPKEIFELLNNKLGGVKQLHGGIFFVDDFPVTPSGKVNRAKVTEMAKTAQRILPE